MNRKNVTIYYGLIMAIYSVGYVAMSAFSSLYLLDIGLSNKAVGILLAIASMVSVLLQPPVGAMIDRNPRISTKKVLLVIGIFILALGIVLIALNGENLKTTTLIYGITTMLLMLAQPFLNALGMDAINFGYKINFGLGRSMGSLGYALGSAAFGRISVMVGPKSVPIAFSIAFAVMCILLVVYPVKKPENVASGSKEKAENPFLLLGKYKRFAVMLIGLMLVYLSHVLINTFSLQIVLTKNGNSSDMGTAASIAAICELITLLLFPLYLKRFKLESMLKVSCFFFVLKIFASFLVPNVILFYLIQVLQMFGWGIMSMGIVYYVNNLVSDHDKAQGQAYAGMAYTIASVIGTFAGGNIIDLYGVNSMLIVGTVLALAGSIVVLFTVGKRKA